MHAFNMACSYLHKKTETVLLNVPRKIKEKTMEIVLRADQAIYLVCTDGTCFVGEDGNCVQYGPINDYKVSFAEIREAVLRACGYAMYAHSDEIRNGYISMGNGCRMAITGMLGTIHNAPAELSSVTAVRIRIGRHIRVNTDFLFKQDKICSVLLVGPPASGKTTLLRSVAQNLSDGTYGRFYRVAVIDERNEIYPDGLIQSPCADVITGRKKEIGINTALRLCSPQVIICDEIGTLAESEAILDSLNSGVKFICSMHAGARDELFRRHCFVRLYEKQVFERIVFLETNSSPGRVSEIIDVAEMMPCEV